MFNNAISDVIELHIKDLDKSENGIYGKLNEVNEMLMVIDWWYEDHWAADLVATGTAENRSVLLLF